MKEKDEMKKYEEGREDEDESVDLNIEDLTDIQGGIEENFNKGDCGLGCFIGSGYGPAIL